jgi:AhpC/TSA family protein
MMQEEEEMRIRMLGRQVPCVALLILTAVSIVGQSRPAGAVEAGEPAPEFKLASTFGNDIALSDYRGKKWVLLEFYGADFAPT